MKKKVSAVLFGAGGYGQKTAADLFQNMQDYGLELVGVADPVFKMLPLRDEFIARGIPNYPTPEDFYRENKADLALVCTPIPFHEKNVLCALENGSDVLCEKPIAANPGQALRMKEAAEKAGKHLNIGFQLSYTPAILKLKEDILSGAFGKPLRFSALVCWPRNKAYYARSWCATRIWKGLPTNDSIAMNACAHYLHLMYFLLGDAMASSAYPDEAEMLLLRANSIETFDSSFFRIHSKGCEIRFLATHTSRERIDPVMRFEFENAVAAVRHSADQNAVSVTFRDGTKKDYGSVLDFVFHKIPYCCDVFRGEKEPVCTVDTAMPHLVTVDAANRLVPVLEIEKANIENETVVLPGIEEILKESFDGNRMPWELTDRFGSPTEIRFPEKEGVKA